LFASNQIQFVQLRIRAAHVVKSNEKLSIGRGFLGGQIILMGLLALACVNHLPLVCGYGVSTSIVPWFRLVLRCI